MSDEQPAVRENVAEQRFEIVVDGEVAGFTQYQDLRGARAFVHTEIDDRFAGRGLGSILVEGALRAMRDSGTAVLPFCPFVRRYVQRHREFQSLVPAAQRARFGLPDDEGSPS